MNLLSKKLTLKFLQKVLTSLTSSTNHFLSRKSSFVKKTKKTKNAAELISHYTVYGVYFAISNGIRCAGDRVDNDNFNLLRKTIYSST